MGKISNLWHVESPGDVAQRSECKARSHTIFARNPAGSGCYWQRTAMTGGEGREEIHTHTHTQHTHTHSHTCKLETVNLAMSSMSLG